MSQENPFTVLIVDDARLMRHNLRGMLERIKIPRIIEACDGEQALGLLKNSPVDLILSDWNMPNITGQELLTWVRRHDQVAQTPFIMLTAESDKAKVLAAVQAGVNNYIIKPFTEETLFKKIRPFLPPNLRNI